MENIEFFKNKENEKEVIDILWEYEKKECEIEEITDMLWLIYEDYYSLQKNDLYTKANNYDRLERYLINLHSLLYTRKEEMINIINKVYDLKEKFN